MLCHSTEVRIGDSGSIVGRSTKFTYEERVVSLLWVDDVHTLKGVDTRYWAVRVFVEDQREGKFRCEYGACVSFVQPR